MINIPTTEPGRELAFVRTHHGADAVAAIFNLSDQPRTVTLLEMPHAGAYRDAFDGSTLTLDDGSTLRLPAWGYRVLLRS